MKVLDVCGVLSVTAAGGCHVLCRELEMSDQYGVTVRGAAVQTAQDAAQQAKEAARMADRYAHDEPWRVAGAALALGAIVGFMLTRR